MVVLWLDEVNDFVHVVTCVMEVDVDCPVALLIGDQMDCFGLNEGNE